MNTNPIEDLLGAGRVVLGLGKTYKADMADNREVDPTRTMNELSTAIDALEDANNLQNAKETAFHEAFLKTGQGEGRGEVSALKHGRNSHLLTRPSGTLSPTGGEDGVRGFMKMDQRARCTDRFPANWPRRAC